MRPGPGAARRADDDGSAVVEFVSLGVLLLLPVVYLVLTLGRIQAATYATEGSARAATRAVVTAQDERSATSHARAAVRLGLLDQGFDVDPDASLAVVCSATPCLTPGATVDVAVSVGVLLPGVPRFLDGVVPTHVSVTSRQSGVVDPFRATTTATTPTTTTAAPAGDAP